MYQSLQRLGIETIDLLYLHCWNESLNRTEVLTTLVKLVQHGKVWMLGASNFTADQFMPGHQQVYFNEQAKRRLKQLQEVATRTGYSMIHLALAWALHQPDVTSVLIGGRNPFHLDQALAALEFNAKFILEALE